MTVIALAVRDVLLAPRCAGCGDAGGWFCVACRDGCDPVALEASLPIRGAGSYAGPLREAVHHLKYGGEPGLATELGGLVALEMARDLAIGIRVDAIVPVPLHPRRAHERGYDQAALLASAIATRTDVPMRAVLRRIRASRPQVELDRIARAKNVRGAFVAEAASLRGLRVALVDDVATTGATLADAAAAARAAGARAVRAYVIGVDA